MVEPKRTSPTKQRAHAGTVPDVDGFLASKHHPLEEEIQEIRAVIKGVDASIREEIKWNSVSFRNDNDFFATVNLRSTSSVQLVFHTGVARKASADSGVQIDDPHGLIEKWASKDRCIVALGKGTALKANKPALAKLVKEWLPFVQKT